MRCEFDRLAEQVGAVIGQDPLSGHGFIFRSRRGDRLKLLTWDHDGFILWYKRLSKGRFRWWPEGRKVHEGARTLAAHQLQVLLAAGDPTATQAEPAWRPVVVLS